MMLRIFLILAILAGLGSGGVAYYQSSVQIPALVQQRDAEKTAKVLEVTAHAATKAKLQKTSAALNLRDQELADSKLEQQKALARADAQGKRADNLQGKLTQMNTDLQNSQGLLAAYQTSGLNPGEVAKLKNTLVAAQRQVASLTEERDTWQHRFLAMQPKDEPDRILMPADLKGSVAVVDPKWNFVVLNIGEKSGVIQDGEMLVSRQGKLVAKVVIKSVQKDECIADLVPGWEFGEVLEGDVVTPANPAPALSML
jgi:hypothetical protein